MIRALLLAGVLFTCLFGAQGYAETIEDYDKCFQLKKEDRLKCYDGIADRRQKASNSSPAANSASAPQPGTQAATPAPARNSETQSATPAAAKAKGNLAACKESNANTKYDADNDIERLRCYDSKARYSWSMCMRGSPAWIEGSPGRLNACKYYFEDTDRLSGYDKITGFEPKKESYKPSYLSMKWRLNEESRGLDEESRRKLHMELEQERRKLEEEKIRLEIEEKSGQLDEKSRQELYEKIHQLAKKRLKLDEKIDQLDKENRKALEELSRQGRLALAYRQNYILLGMNNFHMEKQTWEAANSGKELEDYELKYQLSLKLKLFELTDNWVTRLTGVDWERHLGTHIDVWLAYTQLSFWQVYNASISRPFRETNYEPELIFNSRWDIDLFDDLKFRFFQIALNHQSNGQSEPLSRSWNRILFNFGFERGNFDVILKTWYRLPESDEDDDNTDIESYLGYGEIWAGYTFKHLLFDRDIRLGLMFRNNLRFDDQNRSALQLGVEGNISGPLNWYVQYFTGYGESLIFYNQYANSIGAGFSIKDW